MFAYPSMQDAHDTAPTTPLQLVSISRPIGLDSSNGFLRVTRQVSAASHCVNVTLFFVDFHLNYTTSTKTMNIEKRVYAELRRRSVLTGYLATRRRAIPKSYLTTWSSPGIMDNDPVDRLSKTAPSSDYNSKEGTGASAVGWANNDSQRAETALCIFSNDPRS